jgi:hypothetical protein
VNLSFLSVSPVHIIPALHEVKSYCIFVLKKWLIILKIATWLEIYVSLGSAACVGNIFQYWCILNKTKVFYGSLCSKLNRRNIDSLLLGRGWVVLNEIVVSHKQTEKIKLAYVILKGMSILNQYLWYAINLLPYSALLDYTFYL